mmetsp:Transcript_100978/g.200604  ORF Transcript_100978/g.200604 Transcript_100978/m.200604 type:complete len:356 (-) Transcript_100978:165-1232(-)|eukprot:CAMPEP_0172933550 /NCGR_PEP_ID=MMETSP1075-20121228/220564_1 /TAXON_ID=2916 /ORGANISM="Ceratium fusus, Strain PA161109" /LENGTH=355 /DNA_ID=CAMNT_0013794893 /DNA_START=27 /DNA_END=1094 /DNA_ORIENTATION=+
MPKPFRHVEADTPSNGQGSSSASLAQKSSDCPGPPGVPALAAVAAIAQATPDHRNEGCLSEAGQSPELNGKCFHLRHVVVDRLLEDGTLGLLLHGTSIVGFCTPQAEDFGWSIGDQIVEVNGHRTVTFDDFFDRFVAAQEKGLPIDFSVLRREAVDEAGTENALDGFFGATKMRDLAGALRKKFGTSSLSREAEGMTPSSTTPAEADKGSVDSCLSRSESITENPYIQALRKRRDDLFKTAEGWIIDEGGTASIAVQLATQHNGGLATLTSSPSLEKLEKVRRPGKLHPLAWAGCSTEVGAGHCGSQEAACVASYDIRPTPRADVAAPHMNNADVCTWADDRKAAKSKNLAFQFR